MDGDGGRLRDRVALVTGAASGIGGACALRFAQEGARVAGFDVAGADEPWRQVASAASASDFQQIDVRNEAAVAAGIRAVQESFGRIDVLVNAAGVSGVGGVEGLDADEWDRVLDVNLKGTFLVCKHVMPLMREQGAGSIINLASIEGLEGMEAQAAYNASKGGVVLLTRNMAIDGGPHGVRVNCLCPGLIDTPMTAQLKQPGLEALHRKFIEMHALRRPGRPEEVAAAALFLASDEASFVTGHAMAVDGGFTAGRRLTEPGI